MPSVVNASDVTQQCKRSGDVREREEALGWTGGRLRCSSIRSTWTK